MADAVDMQPATGHIGGHQQLQFAVGEVFQNTHAFFLTHIAGENADGKTVAGQITGDAFAGALFIDKDHAALNAGFAQQMHQQRKFVVHARVIERFGNARRGQVALFRPDLFRRVHMFVGQLQHPVRERGGKHQRLALIIFGQSMQHKTQILDKAQIKHAIRLVDNQHIGLGEGIDPFFQIIDQPARRADENIDAVLKAGTLLFVIDAAIDGMQFQIGIFGQLLAIFIDLDNQLARRRNHQHARVMLRAPRFWLAGQQPVNGRNQKGGGFAGAGAPLPGHILAGQRQRQRRLLHIGHAGKAELINAFLQRFGEVEFGKQGGFGYNNLFHGGAAYALCDCHATRG